MQRNLIIHDPRFSNSLLQRRKDLNLRRSVVLADTHVPSDAIANKVFVVGGGQIWSLLVDAIEAADEGIVRERNVRGVDGERVVLQRT